MRYLFIFLISIFVYSFSFAQGGSARVAYIDMELILQHVPEYTEASAQLDYRAEGWKQEIDKKKEEIKKLKTDLANERVLLTRDLINEKEEDISSLEDDLLKYQQKYFGTD